MRYKADFKTVPARMVPVTKLYRAVFSNGLTWRILANGDADARVRIMKELAPLIPVQLKKQLTFYIEDISPVLRSEKP